MKADDILNATDDMSVGDLDYLIRNMIEIRTKKATDEMDESALIGKAFSEGFTSGGEPQPIIDHGNGIVSIHGVVKDTSKNKHQCALYTVRMSKDSSDEWWQWDEDCPTFLFGETVKVGPLRRTVSFHSLPSDALLLLHRRTSDGEFHSSKSVRGLLIAHDFDDDSDISKTYTKTENAAVIRRLPPPKEDMF